jgi:hypothetical protein
MCVAVVIDNCLSVPCENGANCTNGVNSYTCQCQLGYFGAVCDQGMLIIIIIIIIIMIYF